jgi:hypothetical protein
VVRWRGPHGALAMHTPKHGACRNIPAADRGKPVLATVRNPYDLYVSQYEFGWWRRREWRPVYEALPDFRARYPRFPDLSFADFVALYNEAFPAPGSDRAPGGGVGKLTQEFVQYFFRDPGAVFPALDEAYLASPEAARDMYDVRFLTTHRLRDGLHDALVDFGHAPADVAFVREMGRVLPGGKGRSAKQAWERYYTPALKAEVRERERLLFARFPEFDA